MGILYLENRKKGESLQTYQDWKASKLSPMGLTLSVDSLPFLTSIIIICICILHDDLIIYLILNDSLQSNCELSGNY